jgi:transposase
VPDAVHEAVRDLVRARETAADDLRSKRQKLLSFLLRHGRIYSDSGHWTLAHRRWLAKQSFEPAAQQIVFQEAIDAIEEAFQRLRRLEQQLALIVPSWSMAPVVEATGAAYRTGGHRRFRRQRSPPPEMRRPASPGKPRAR